MICYDSTNKPAVTFERDEDCNVDLSRAQFDIVHWTDSDGKVHARLNHANQLKATDLPAGARRDMFTVAFVLERVLSCIYPAEAFKPAGK